MIIFGTIILILILLSMSFLMTTGLFWIICWIFGWAFNWLTAIGIWIISFILSLIFSAYNE